MRFTVSRLIAAATFASICTTFVSGAEKIVERTTAPRPSAAIPPTAAPASTKAEQDLAAAAEDQKFTFILFWKESSSTTRERATFLEKATASRSERATWTSVNVSDPAEKRLVQKFQLSRTPMPMVLAVAPNGAVTGVFQKDSLTEELVDESLVTPCMTKVMKSLQDGKLVLVCIQPKTAGAIPQGLKDFKADPHFRDRTVSIEVSSADPAEERFLNDMQVDPSTMKAPITAFLAPPGVLVGKYKATATKDQLAAGLAAAGKCCDDPNCKHHQPRK